MKREDSRIIYCSIEKALESSQSSCLEEFSKIKDNAEKVKFVSNFMADHGLLDDSAKTLKIPKNDEAADKGRNEAKKLIAKGDYINAVTKYNESLCFAESQKNLALTYGDRSAVCFKLKMYQTCLHNIEMAKSHGYPAEKMQKLDARAEKCQQLIAEGAESDMGIMKATSGEEFLKLSHPPHPKLPYIAGCLRVKFNKNFGNHIITKKRLQPGDVIFIEPPFAKSVVRRHTYRHCINCLDNSHLSLIPCPLSTSAMFCSQKCKDEAFDLFYEHKIAIIDELHRILPIDADELLAIDMFFKSLKLCDGSLEKLKSMDDKIENSQKTPMFDFVDPNDPISVLSLETHASKLDAKMTFMICGAVAVIVDLFKRHSNISETIVKTENDWDFVNDFLFKQLLIASFNSHNFGKNPVKKPESTEDFHFKFAGGEHLEPGLGIFPFQSQISFSSNPNVELTSTSRESVVVVTQLIKSGEQLFIRSSGNLKARLQNLRELYYWDCNCKVCSDKLAEWNRGEMMSLASSMMVKNRAQMEADYDAKANAAFEKFIANRDDLDDHESFTYHDGAFYDSDDNILGYEDL